MEQTLPMTTTKKRLRKSFKWYARLAELIQYGIPIAYIIFEYDIFQTRTVNKYVTGGIFLVVIVMYFFFRSKIKTMITDYNKYLTEVGQKAKWGLVFTTITLLLILSSLWIRGTIIFFGVIAFANFLSLPFWVLFYSREKQYTRLKEMLLKQRDEDKIKGMTL